jgi:hypothetical protein
MSLYTKDDLQTIRRWIALWQELCDCAGPQPGLSGSRVDEHSKACPYRQAVESDNANAEQKRGEAA